MTDDRIRAAMSTMLAPHGGGGGHLRDRRRAAAVLVEAGDAGHAAVRDALAAAPPGASVTALVRLLPAFGRAEDVDLLAGRLRDGDDPDRIVAAQALAEHPAPRAFDVLVEAHAGPADAAAAAAQALPLRGDQAACDALREAQSHPDQWVRECAVDAAADLGC